MNPFFMITMILATVLLICLLLGYAIFVLLKRIRSLEKTVADAISMIRKVNEIQAADLETRQKSNPSLLIVLNKVEKKDESSSDREGAKREATIH